jgi:high-affinity iron transporter
MARVEILDDDGNRRAMNPFDLHPSEPEIRIPEPPAFSTESVKRGAGIYRKAGCAICHGDTGKGDGRSAPGMKDDWGNAIEPADLTRGPEQRKGGHRHRDLFRTITIGIPGTPMPGLVSFPEADRWDLVRYVWSLNESNSFTPPPSEKPPR